jgi:hypothetical protein
MALIFSTALLVASATAQLTTSIWVPEHIFRTDKFGFYGSVVGADESHTTLLLTYDNGTDKEALGFGSTVGTWTVGPDLLEIVQTMRIADSRTASDSRPDDEDYRIRCERQSGSSSRPICTVSEGRVVAGRRCSQPRISTRSLETRLFSRTHSYSGRGSYTAGVETIIDTMVYNYATEPIPDWCTNDTFPSTFTGTTQTVPFDSDVKTYQVVITAGLEKLNATAGVTGSPPTVQPTVAQTASASLPTLTAAAPMITAGPAVVGLGAAMAALFL